MTSTGKGVQSKVLLLMGKILHQLSNRYFIPSFLTDPRQCSLPDFKKEPSTREGDFCVNLEGGFYLGNSTCLCWNETMFGVYIWIMWSNTKLERLEKIIDIPEKKTHRYSQNYQNGKVWKSPDLTPYSNSFIWKIPELNKKTPRAARRWTHIFHFGLEASKLLITSSKWGRNMTWNDHLL